MYIFPITFFLQDFIDVYLKEMETNLAFNEQDLVGLCMDFFEAGGETVGSTLTWVLMYLALYPEVQEKCFQELMQAIGKNSNCHDVSTTIINRYISQGRKLLNIKIDFRHHIQKPQSWRFKGSAVQLHLV